MKNLKTRLAILLLSTLCLLTGAYAQITPSADAYTNTATPTTNLGAKPLLDVESASQTSYIQFDLSALPSGYTGSNISKATLKLYVNAVTTAASFNVDYVNGSWAENTITANLAPALGTTIVASVPLSKSNVHDYILIDITPALQAWLNGTQANDGIALVGNSPLNASFDSKESTTQSHPPELDVVFAGGGTITGVTTASGSGLTGGGTSGTLNLSLTNACAAKQILQWNGSAWVCASAGTGTVTSVGLSAPSSDFTVKGSPVTKSGTLALNWTTAPTSADTANAIVKRDANGSFSAGPISASTSSSNAAVTGVETSGNGGNDGVYGTSTNGHGVEGNGGYTGVFGTGGSYGLYGIGPIGVYGNGTTYGVYGYGATGVAGVSSGGAYPGVYAQSGAGGWAVDAYNTSSGTGVLAGSVSGWAAWFNGNVEVDGNLSKGGGSFKIDHPLDPANKYLYHSFVESPDMMNIYNGNVTTDTKGDALVHLPEWFETLNRDFRYQLTVIGQFAQAIVSQEIANGRFSIKTDKPNVKVSWQVTGIRQDAWANAHRIPVEEDKPEQERGFYLHPELYGAAEEKGVLWARSPQAMKQWKEARTKAAATDGKEAPGMTPLSPQ